MINVQLQTSQRLHSLQNVKSFPVHSIISDFLGEHMVTKASCKQM